MTIGIGKKQSGVFQTPLANHYSKRFAIIETVGLKVLRVSPRHTSMSETHFRKANSVDDRELEEEVKQLTVCFECIIYCVLVIIYRTRMWFLKRLALRGDM